MDHGKVSIQGFLQKKGYFNRYKKRYFYLERHLLKWGDKEGRPQKMVDLSQDGATRITINDEKIRQFKIHFFESAKAQKHTVFKMKADNKVQRDEWVAALKKAIEPFIQKNPEHSSQPMGSGSQVNTPITLTKLPINKMNLSKQRSITLNQITEQLVKSKE